MKTSPFKVMTTAALATALAVPAVATTADAAEVELKQIAFELDGEVQIVDFNDYIDAIVSESGDLYDFVDQASPEAIGVGEGSFVSYEALVDAIIDDEEGKTGKEVLAEVSTDAEARVSEDTVAEYKVFGEEEVEELAVNSVEATNLLQVEVNYNQDVSGNEAAANKDNYDLGDETVSSVSVDGETATVTLENDVDNQAERTLTVDSDVTGEEVEQDVTFFDTTIPEVTGAEVVGQDTIKVKFTEPVNTTDENGDELNLKDSFSVNDGEYFVKDVEVVKPDEFNVKLYSSLEEGTVDFSVDNSLEDFAGFNVTATDLELEVVEDNDAPEVVEYKDASPQGVTLVFNEDIQITDDADLIADFYHTNSNNPVVSDVEANGNELELTFVNDDTNNALPEGTAYVYVAGDSIVDLWGNVNENQLRTEVNVEVDEIAPEVDGDVEVVSESKVEVPFTEAVTDLDEEDFTLLDENGDEADLIKDLSFKSGSDDKVVEVEFDEKLSGTYALVIEKLDDLAGNQIDKVTKAFDVDDLTAPTFNGNDDTKGFSSKLYNAGEEVQKLVVNFNEKMATDGKYSVLDLDKYEYNNTTLSNVAGAKITALDNGSKVEITVPGYDSDDETGLDLSSYYLDENDEVVSEEVSIARVADAGGNYTPSLSGDVTIDQQGYVGVESVEAVATDEVQVTFNDTFADFDANDIEFYQYDSENDNYIVDGEDNLVAVDTAGAKVSTNDDGNTVVTYKLDDEVDYDATVGDNDVVATVVDTESVNRYNESLAKDEDESGDLALNNKEDKTLADGINAEFDKKESIAVDGDDVATKDDTTVTATADGNTSFDLVFTEEVKGTAAAFGTYFTVGDYVFEPDTNDLNKGEYNLELKDIDNETKAVTVTVYGESSDEIDVDFAENGYFTDSVGNTVKDFSVTVDVYTEE